MADTPSKLSLDHLSVDGPEKILGYGHKELNLQWLNLDASLAITSGSLGVVASGVDHGSLAGLSDDDHGAVYPGYAQTETITGTWTFDSHILFNPTTAPSHTEGLLYYDSTDKALSYYNDEADVTVNLGQENLVRVRNVSGALIPNGSAVYISGATGASLPNIDLARADALSTSRVLGLATHDIENNSNGYITTVGSVNDLDTSAFLAGDTLFLSTSVAGELQNTRPTTGFAVVVGYCLVSNPSIGEIKVATGETAQRADITSASQNETITGSWTFSANVDMNNNDILNVGDASTNIQTNATSGSEIRRTAGTHDSFVRFWDSGGFGVIDLDAYGTLVYERGNLLTTFDPNGVKIASGYPLLRVDSASNNWSDLPTAKEILTSTNNSTTTTLANIFTSNPTVAANAEATYIANITYDADTTPDIKFGWSYPTSCQIEWGYSTINTLTETSTLTLAGGGSGALRTIQIIATIRNGANEGTVALQFAMNAAGLGDANIYAGSGYTCWTTA